MKLSAQLSIAEKHPNKVAGSGAACRDFARPQAHVHDDMQVVAHNRPGVNTTGENLAQLQNACLDPGLSMLETFAEIFVQATQPRSAHAAIDAVKRSGLGGVNKLAAGLGHGRTLGVRTLRENQIGRNFGSDSSEGWVSALRRAVRAATRCENIE